MSSEHNISQLLEGYPKFDIALWASYSIDIETLMFLLRMDFMDIMEPCSLHVICDESKMGLEMQRTKSNGRLKDLHYLQSYYTLSSQRVPGSFHPKILLLASQEVILVLISSANATDRKSVV